MTTTTPIYKILRLSELDYEEDYFQKYMRWCHAQVKENENGPNFGQLLANAAVSNWYNGEISKLEIKFSKMIANTHQHMEIAQIRQIYVAVTSHVFTYYPRPLLDAAKGLKIINTINLN